MRVLILHGAVVAVLVALAFTLPERGHVRLTIHDLHRCAALPSIVVLPSCDAARSSVVGGGALLGLTAAISQWAVVGALITSVVVGIAAGIDPAACRAALARIAERGCRFLVFGRDAGKGFVALGDLELEERVAPEHPRLDGVGIQKPRLGVDVRQDRVSGHQVGQNRGRDFLEDHDPVVPEQDVVGAVVVLDLSAGPVVTLHDEVVAGLNRRHQRNVRVPAVVPCVRFLVEPLAAVDRAVTNTLGIDTRNAVWGLLPLQATRHRSMIHRASSRLPNQYGSRHLNRPGFAGGSNS